MTTLLQELFTYFAKYPAHEGVKNTFNRSTSIELGQAYIDLKATIQNLSVHSLVPDIKHYIFGIDETDVKKRIAEMRDTYLFIDQGTINSDLVNPANVEQNTVFFAITVAKPIRENEYDGVELLMIKDKLLNIIGQIQQQMKRDSKNSPLLTRLNFPYDINPWHAPELNNSHGFTMMATTNYIDLFG